MNRIYFIFLFLIFSGAVHGQTAKKRMNFIYYITDDIGRNDVGAFGNKVIKTPNIDELAQEGLLFQNGYVATSSCSPSRCSMISGRYPHNTGAPELHNPLPPDQFMFPQLLNEAGYYTVLSGKNHMGPHVKNAFDTISLGVGPGAQEDWTWFIRNRPKEKPFFFWFGSHDAHRPWQFDDKGTIYDPDDIQVPPMLYDGPVTREDLAGYYHEISRADYYLGELVKELKKEGILNSTYIIFLSDNGRPFPRCKTRLYDSGDKVPLIIYGPDVKVGDTDALVSAIDIAPTVLDLAGVKQDRRIQGKSFSEVLLGKANSVRDFLFAEHNWHIYKNHERMVRFGDWMYIRNAYPERQVLAGESTRVFPAGKELWEAHDRNLTKPQQEDVFLVPRPAEELYNVKDDPFQFNNVADVKENAETLDYLRNVLDQWIVQTGDSKPSNPTPDKERVSGKALKGFKRGEKPGESKNATSINHSGPVNKNDTAF
ncbi:MAG: sulfatase [Fulvivirga sp.]